MSEKDYRMSLVRDLETALCSVFDPAQITIISTALVKSLADYEISARCTDLMPYDDGNDKILRRFKACLLVDGKSAKTVRVYELVCRKLYEAIGKPYTEMGVYDIRLFLAMLIEQGKSNRTRENYRAYISSFFSWMTADGFIEKNPMISVKPIKYTDEVRKAFSSVEIDALRTSCKNKKERAMIEVLLSSGVRVEELTQLKKNDVDFNTLTVHVRHGKGDKGRITYINDVAAKHLISYLRERKDDDPHLFIGIRGAYTTGGIRAAVKQIGKRAGVDDVHPHKFRRTFATNLSKRGMQLQEIQRLMGHSEIKTTMEYIDLDDNTIAASYRNHIA